MPEKPKTRTAALVETVKPSGSTVASSIGGAISILVVFAVEQLINDPLPAAVVGAITVLITVGAGWFFTGGRSVDTTD